MKLKDLLQVLYGYNVIDLYDSTRQYLGGYSAYYNFKIKEEYQNQKVLSIWVNNFKQLEITIEKN